MSIDRIHLGGNYGSYGAGMQGRKSKQKPEANEVPQTQINTTEIDEQEVWNTMELLSQQFRVQSMSSNSIPNPENYLSENQISGIKAAMVDFSTGVEKVANVIREEFPDLSDDMVYTLASQVYAKE